MQELADWILGWSEAVDCHEQSDPLKARGYIRDCKDSPGYTERSRESITERSLTA